MTAHPRRPVVAVLATAALLALGACSSSADIEEARSEGSAAEGITVDTTPVSDEAVALLPPGSFEDGVLRVSVTQGAVPLAFFADDNSTVIGSATDLATIVADALGLDVEFVVDDWSNWPLSVQDRWGLQDEAVDSSQLNPPGLGA